MNGKRLTICTDLSATELRRVARREPDRAAAARMGAIANALQGMMRIEAAWLAGMERQALRDAVVRYNAEGTAGLHDRPRPGRERWLSEEQRRALRQLVRSLSLLRQKARPSHPKADPAAREAWSKGFKALSTRPVPPTRTSA